MAVSGGAAGDAGHRMVTPEAVELDLPLADLGSRSLALLLDLTATYLVVYLVAVAATIGAVGVGIDAPTWVPVVLGLLLVFTIVLGYPVLMEARFGRTLGKMALGLRVVTVDGGPIGLREAALRAVLLQVDVLATLGVAGVLSVLVSRRRQRLGDMAAGTVVLRERSAPDATTRATRFVAPPYLAVWSQQLDTSGLDADARRALRALLVRAPALPPEVRDGLAADLLERLRPVLAPPPPPGVHPGEVLLAVGAAVQDRLGA
ncbi:MAG: RDD family protein [Actinomycetes bacterium]